MCFDIYRGCTDSRYNYHQNIDNVIPDRAKGDTIKYKRLLAGTLVELQEKIFSYLSMLYKKPTEEQLREIEAFMGRR